MGSMTSQRIKRHKGQVENYFMFRLFCMIKENIGWNFVASAYSFCSIIIKLNTPPVSLPQEPMYIAHTMTVTS